jgi:integrase
MGHVTPTTGMRRSEVLGLRWDPVDLNSAHVELTGPLVMVAGQRHFSELTKTRASRWRNALDRRIVELIRSHRVRQVQLRREAGELWENTLDPVFTDEVGQPVSPNLFTRSFQAEARRLDLAPIGVHGLRHSLATTALADGVSPKIVSERPGRTSIATTLDRYSHVSEEQDREVAEALALRIARE